MTKLSNFFKKTNGALIVLISAFALTFTPEGTEIINTLIMLSVPVVLCLPRLFKWLTGLKADPFFEFVYIIYVLFAQVLSGMFALYSSTALYDKAMHLLSGLLSAAFALVLLRTFSLENARKIFQVIFFISLTLCIAVFWEFFEFFGDTLFHRNAQRVQTGVTDTMLDMLCALAGAVVYSFGYIICIKSTDSAD